ncbi:hypothetical protein SF123566_0105 [Shigella flexneri 1235-66]|nr:hypothetical protein SF123566_0105 [Shigella flexneri 1235-66]
MIHCGSDVMIHSFLFSIFAFLGTTTSLQKMHIVLGRDYYLAG